MRRILHHSLLAGLFVLGGCNSIFGIKGGALTGTGGTGGAGDSATSTGSSAMSTGGTGGRGGSAASTGGSAASTGGAGGTGGTSTTTSTTHASSTASSTSSTAASSTSSTAASSTAASSTATSSSSSTGGVSGCNATTFPLTPVLDNFNRADGALGAKWSVDTTGGYQISGDQAVGNTGTPGIMVWSDVFGPAQEMYVTISALDAGDGELELILKNQGMITECDSIEVDYQPNGAGPGQGEVGIYACTPGSPGSYGTASLTLAAGDQFGARACADGTVKVFKNGVQVVSYSVAPFAYATSGGRIGFFSSDLTAPAHLDNFGGGTLP